MPLLLLDFNFHPQLLAALVGATAMATWHAALFMEMEKVHEPGFPLTWPNWLQVKSHFINHSCCHLHQLIHLYHSQARLASVDLSHRITSSSEANNINVSKSQFSTDGYFLHRRLFSPPTAIFSTTNNFLHHQQFSSPPKIFHHKQFHPPPTTFSTTNNFPPTNQQ